MLHEIVANSMILILNNLLCKIATSIPSIILQKSNYIPNLFRKFLLPNK